MSQPATSKNRSRTDSRKGLARASGSAVDLSQYSDLFVLRVVAKERPEFVDILAGQIDRGRTDTEIIRIVCDAGGSPQAMRYAQKILRALRNLPNDPSSATRPTSGHACNRSAMAGFAAAHG